MDVYSLEDDDCNELFITQSSVQDNDVKDIPEDENEENMELSDVEFRICSIQMIKRRAVFFQFIRIFQTQRMTL